MKKALIFLMAFFVVIAGYSCIYNLKNPAKDKDTNVSYEDAEYPESMRPGLEEKTEEETSETTATDLIDEILPDENFTEFEIEEDEEAQTEDEAAAPAGEEIAAETEEEAVPEVAATEVEITERRVNIRASSNSRAKILGEAKLGDTGILIEEGESWSLIRVGEIEGYISNKFWKIP